MPKVEHHTPGTFCWWELATPDLDAVWRFYHGLFRWEKRDAPSSDGQVYRICVLEGQDVCAMYQLSTDQRERKGAAAWLPYVAVNSVDNTLERARKHKGAVLQPPLDVPESGRMAVCADPEGARFALWEPKQHAGAGLVGEIGTVAWTELSARDVTRVGAFYNALFDWKPETRTVGPSGEYSVLNVAGERESFGGMLQQPPWGAAQDPGWWTYFRVASCDESAAAISATGGRVGVGPFEVPGVGRIAVATDPAGAGFALIEPEPRR